MALSDIALKHSESRSERFSHFVAIKESMKKPGAVAMLPSRITPLYSERLSYNRDTNWRICPVVRYSGLQFWFVTIMRPLSTPLHLLLFGHSSGDHFVDC
jgi:hypothetical protein